MSKYFITFGAGNNNYIQAVNRLSNQIEETNLFDYIISYTDKDLKEDDDFWEEHHYFIENNPKGYGYWLWKPYLIKKTISKMQNGDILLYLDCGCEIDINKKDLIYKYFEYVKNDLIIGSSTGCNEKDWCKMDLILKLDANKSYYLDSFQRQGGAVMYLVCDKTSLLIDEWYKICCYYHMIDDSPSMAANLDCFIEHRHDQAIFSLLTKKYNLYSKINLDYLCIKCIRNRTGKSIYQL